MRSEAHYKIQLQGVLVSILLSFALICSACSSSLSPTSEPPSSPATANGPAAGGAAATGEEVAPPPSAHADNVARSTKRRDIFIDVTQQSGIDFTHFNGKSGEFLLPEITGSGGALFDYDNDGDLDLYLVQGAVLLEAKKVQDSVAKDNSPKDKPWRDRLFRNDGPEETGGVPRFTDVTDTSGIHAPGYGMGVATGDFNNDGWVDLYVTNVGSNQLWKNNGDGTFSDWTSAAGADDPRWSTSASFFDYDRDGWLDLFVTNYVNFSTDKIPKCFSPSSARDYCGPDAYDAVPDMLLHNRGDGTFENVTIASGIINSFGAGLGVVAADFNNDGWTDVYVANDGDPNQLWINQQGKGKFADEALLAGAALNRMGQAEAGMGVDAGDFDNDGDEDLFMTHIERESNTLYINQGNGMFEDRTIEAGLHAGSLTYTAFGTGFFDYDNDGWLDLLVLNGTVRIIESLARQGDPYPLHQPNQLFRNNGKAGFVEVTGQAGRAFQVSEVSRGAIFGDVDDDGDVDVVIVNNNGPARLLLNNVGNRRNWIGLRLRTADGKRDACQARVKISLDNGATLWRRVHTDGSYCSAGDPRLIVGLGDQNQPVNVEVHWPDGEVDARNPLNVNQHWILQQGSESKSK